MNRQNAETLSFNLDEESPTKRESFLSRQNCKSHSFELEGDDAHLTDSAPKRATFVDNLSLFKSCRSQSFSLEEDMSSLSLEHEESLATTSKRQSFLDRQHAKSHSFSLDEDDDELGELPMSTKRKTRLLGEHELVDRPSWART